MGGGGLNPIKRGFTGSLLLNILHFPQKQPPPLLHGACIKVIIHLKKGAKANCVCL